MTATLGIRRISAIDALPIRAAILRPQLPQEACFYPGDDVEETLHAGAFIQTKLVGVASVFNEPIPFQSDLNAWRLRGMAVIETARRQGIGQTLVNYCFQYASRMGGEIMWCYARTVVIDFYLKCGFQPKGEEFMIHESGAHILMWQPIHKTVQSIRELRR